ncbi:hypothetical protein JGH11_18480 [Dysgonomonas sp. Marseille-P4677]|uniref:hypothetical protein n=1 Tax=Dysgonomonas sp. Marseille-P4677 TaxID=2364790 RepID=UPI001911B5CD|nr:hypothetical protein [Dysgonomonas sp. Marseille-P4677]MBK5722861.1 hypothetical protein [Dysgonomonas sp. Marseille-P4677]
MKKHFYLAPILLLIIIVLTACPDDDLISIRLINNSNRNVVAYIGEEGLGEPTYPDTSLPSKNLTRPVSKDRLGQYLFRKEIERTKVCIFFLDQDTITKYGWDKVRDDYMILKRIDIDMQYLRQKEVNFIIRYEDPEPEQE